MIAVLLLAAAVSAAPDGLCGLCHPGSRVEFEHSVHNAEGIGCTSCHGGDATAATVAAAHRGDFRGRIQRADVPALCASCHADASRMGPYNLPSDQYALYQTSRHGRELAKGDSRVAVCTDCHGVHSILHAGDPASPTHPLKIAATCGRCHSDHALMGRYGLTGDPAADFMSSVHGAALLESGNTSAPTCSRCHGSHGATPPGVGDVEKVCGQCHPTTRAQFLDGPHKRAMDAAKLPECASCHGNHAVAKVGIGALETVCVNCHAAESAPAELARQMKTLYSAASDQLVEARRIVDQAAAIPLYVDDHIARLEEARTALGESLPAMHSLNLDRVEQITSRARSIGAEVESEVNGTLKGRAWRRVGLLIFWFYLLVTVGILARYRAKASRQAVP